MEQDSTVELSIVMPCLNESATLPVCIDKAIRFLKDNNIKGEIIVSDNGSSDDSKKIAVSHGARVIDSSEPGYGNALLAGIKAAKGKYIIMGDSDDSYDFYDLNKFIVQLRQGYDLVVGNRFQGEIKPGAMPFMHRYIGNPLLSGIGKLFFKTKVGDFHCGLRGFRKDSVLRLDLQAPGMEFASEMIVKSVIFHYKICEVPIVLHMDGRERASHLRKWRDGWRHLEFLLIYSPRWLFLYPGMVSILLGIIFIDAVLFNNIFNIPVNLGMNSIIYGIMAIVAGYQAVIFSFFSKVYAESQGLIPPDPGIRRLFREFNLRIMMAGGAFMILFSIILLILIINSTGIHPPVNSINFFSTKYILLSALSFILGTQTTLAGFFLHILRLKGKGN
ncbi:MAG: glycosyl transferase family 2 [Ignavibacteria bacterium]|nr:glycosyl transferase family 2 [Ignavibacteria bacterium]